LINKQVLAQAVLVLSLTACGGSGSGGNSTGNAGTGNSTGSSGNSDPNNGNGTNNGGTDNSGVSGNGTGNSNTGSGQFYYGAVSATEIPQAGISLFGAIFFRDSEQFSAQQLLNLLQSDNCVLNNEEPDDGVDDNSVDVSAGETIIISGNGGTVATLTRQSLGNAIIYQTPQTSGSLPAGLVVDIPGDDFPAFSGATFPAARPFQLSSPTINTVFTAGDQINWNAGSSSSAVFIDIEFGNQFGETSQVECEVRDDGNFSLPSSIVDRIGADLEAIEFNIVRNEFNFVERGNALLSTSTLTGVNLEY